ncbi:invasion associated locus B family protein [Falsiroseomonas oryzae]|uniref:invasion associated locus B family protein n=1 Tax=Falsiroseomonas oryzae TaxID=2766473 RepID=UPI0022EB2C2F|nr:invasion associated locus B family protein [Roseomonas sp. MO-31]
MPRNRFLAAGAVLAAALLALPALAQPQRAQGPQRLGAHGEWTAATHEENGQKVCYAFARAARSDGAPPNRGAVTLTVAHRAIGRDQVAVSVGAPLPRGAEAVMTIGNAEFRSYGTVQSSAFFQSGAQLIGAFRNGREAVVRSPGAGGRGTVTDTFSLSGFSAAYDAISRECPARPAR